MTHLLFALTNQVSDPEPMKRLFDPTISLGTLITIASFVYTLYRFHIANVARFTKLEAKVDLMWLTFKKRFGMPAEDDE